MLDDKVFPTLYVNIGTDENPDFLVARGSSQQEGLHSGFQSSFVQGASSPETTFDQMHLYSADNNLSCSRRKRHLKIGRYSNDMVLFNNIVQAVENLKEMGVIIDLSDHLLADWNYLTPADPKRDFYQDPSESGLAPDSECSVDQAFRTLKKLAAAGVPIVQHRVDRDRMTSVELAKEAERYAQGTNLHLNPTPRFTKRESRVLIVLLLKGSYDPTGALKKIMLESPRPTHDALRALLPTHRSPGGNVCILPKLDIKRLTLDWNLCALASSMGDEEERLNFAESGECKLMPTAEQAVGVPASDAAFIISGQVYTVPRKELHAKTLEVVMESVVRIAVQGLYHAADEQLKQAWIAAGWPAMPDDGYTTSVNDPANAHMLAPAPMDLIMPNVAQSDRVNVQIQGATVDVPQVQSAPVSVSVCPACDSSLLASGKHSPGCVLRLVMGYGGSNEETNALKQALNLRKRDRSSGFTQGVWDAMQWGMVFREGEHAGVLEHVREEYRQKQARALVAKRQQKSRNKRRKT